MKLALALHTVACCCTAGFLHRRLLEGPRAWSFGLIFACTFFVPILGLLGLISVSLTAPRGKAPSEPDCIQTRIPRPPGTPVEQPGAAAGTSGPAGGRQARLEALALLRERSDPSSIALLRRGLEDPDEDVRLLAHALLESKSRAICRNIEQATRSLQDAPATRRGALHRRLASQYWELAWLGLVQGECLDHALATARQYALAALEQDPASASLHFLLGRIHLRLSSSELAEVSLARACELGLSAKVVRPYLAEAAFLRRRFDLVRTHLEQLGPSSHATVARMRRYWS